MAASAPSIPGSSLGGATTPNTEFTFFSKLPTEMRFMIWNLALPGPRIIRMNRRYALNRDTGREELRFSPANALSGLGMLHTNREARAEALATFKMISDFEPKIDFPVYLRAEDMLYFTTIMGLEDFVENVYGQCVGVRRIAVGVKDTQGMSGMFINWKHSSRAFRLEHKDSGYHIN